MLNSKVRYYRIKKGLSQEELGFEIKRSTKFISDIETNKTVPLYYDILALVEVLDVSPNILMDDTKEIDDVYNLLSMMNRKQIETFEKIVRILIGLQ